jgi:hypothetical protein
VDVIVPVAAGDGVVADVAVEIVVAAIAGNGVVAVVADDQVVAVAAVEDVVAKWPRMTSLPSPPSMVSSPK